MKYFCVFVLLGLCAFNSCLAVTQRHNRPAVALTPTTTSQRSLSQDLDEIARLIPTKAIQRLAIRYLLNDAQFQAFVRVINSYDGFLTHTRFRSQPEVIAFKTWLHSQIMLSGDDLESNESNESLKLINRTPFWSLNVFGWKGFVNEFHLYYPEEQIRMQVQTKVAEKGVFADFIERLKNLKSVYDRVMATPEAQRLITTLESNGIETAAIDYFIRNQFGWQEPSNSSAGLQ